MAKAIEQGIPKMRIEEAAARTQARIDAGTQKVIGVNTFRLADEDQLDVLRVDNDDVYRQQIAKLERLRAERDDDDVRRALDALTASAERGPAGDGSLDGNLLALAVDAARAKATVGEISDALEKVYGRHQAVIRTISGVYRDEAGAAEGTKVAEVLAATEEFEAEEGRRPRILVAKMGQDGHDRGQKVVVTAFADLGFDVDVGPLFSTPEEVAQQAVDADVHIVGVSSLAAGHLTLLPALKQALADQGRPDIMIVIGGVIPPDDVETLREMGAAAVFLPGTVIAESALDLLARLREQHADEGEVRAQRASSLTSPRSSPGIRDGQRAAVSRAITLVESSRPEHRLAARELLTELASRDRPPATRVGISGVPGVGKSTFIESLGSRLTGAGHRVGVLAVDPSSVRTGRLGARRQDPDVARWRSTRTPTSVPRRRPARSAASPGPPRRRCWCSRPPATTSCSSRPSGWASPRSPSPAWSTPSCSSPSPAPATSCRASRRASSRSPTWSRSTRPTASTRPRPASRPASSPARCGWCTARASGRRRWSPARR